MADNYVMLPGTIEQALKDVPKDKQDEMYGILKRQYEKAKKSNDVGKINKIAKKGIEAGYFPNPSQTKPEEKVVPIKPKKESVDDKVEVPKEKSKPKVAKIGGREIIFTGYLKELNELKRDYKPHKFDEIESKSEYLHKNLVEFKKKFMGNNGDIGLYEKFRRAKADKSNMNAGLEEYVDKNIAPHMDYAKKQLQENDLSKLGYFMKRLSEKNKVAGFLFRSRKPTGYIATGVAAALLAGYMFGWGGGEKPKNYVAIAQYGGQRQVIPNGAEMKLDKTLKILAAGIKENGKTKEIDAIVDVNGDMKNDIGNTYRKGKLTIRIFDKGDYEATVAFKAKQKKKDDKRIDDGADEKAKKAREKRARLARDAERAKEKARKAKLARDRKAREARKARDAERDRKAREAERAKPPVDEEEDERPGFKDM